MLRIFAYINLINSILLFGAATLIYLPAPIYPLWLVAVIASESPLSIAILGLILLAVSQGFIITRKFKWLATISACLTSLAIATALTDIGSIYEYAKLKNRPLSWSDCFKLHGDGERFARKLEAQDYTQNSDQPLALDIYEPIAQGTTSNVNKTHPAIVVIHGGSWHGGRRSDFRQCDYWLAGLGYTVFDVDYRLCNAKVHFPAPEEDIELALTWIDANAAKYHVDPARIGLLGRSAGAQLALVTAYKTTLDGTLNNPIRCVVSLYGPTDLAWDYANPIKPDVINACSVLSNYIGGTPADKPKLYAEASPCDLVCDDTPPTLFIHGGRDQLVSDRNVDRLMPILAKHKIPCEYCLLPWANHGFDWHFNGFSSQLDKFAMADFLKKYLPIDSAPHP